MSRHAACAVLLSVVLGLPYNDAATWQRPRVVAWIPTSAADDAPLGRSTPLLRALGTRGGAVDNATGVAVDDIVIVEAEPAPPPPPKKKLLILMSDTGGGHRASAQALMDSLERLYPGAIESTMLDLWTHAPPYPFNQVSNRLARVERASERASERAHAREVGKYHDRSIARSTHARAVRKHHDHSTARSTRARAVGKYHDRWSSTVAPRQRRVVPGARVRRLVTASRSVVLPSAPLAVGRCADLAWRRSCRCTASSAATRASGSSRTTRAGSRSCAGRTTASRRR